MLEAILIIGGVLLVLAALAFVPNMIEYGRKRDFDRRMGRR